jgi:hypothetical protein
VAELPPATAKPTAGVETLDAHAPELDHKLLLHGAQKICKKAIGGRFDAWIVFDNR